MYLNNNYYEFYKVIYKIKCLKLNKKMYIYILSFLNIITTLNFNITRIIAKNLLRWIFYKQRVKLEEIKSAPEL